jgi:GT2 family glycosyltransferase
VTGREVSVVVVSRGRPAALMRCLLGLSQLYHTPFEVIVVACPAGLAVLNAAGWDGRIKTVGYDHPNISIARNLGTAQAAGEIVAFIDDDAVPEPTWLCYLIAPFDRPYVSASGGFVRGRNGIGYQWKARLALADATTRPMPAPEDSVTLHNGAPGRAAKTEGTNMAIRRQVLARMGGFDPAFRFYLDETDLNLRLGAAKARTAIVPMAQVHHGFAASDRRRGDRVPLSLYEIGASHAAFLRRHGGPGLDALALRAAERDVQRARLLGHMVAGRLEPRAVKTLLAGFDAGWTEGAARPIVRLPPIADPDSDFLRLSRPEQGTHTLLIGRSWQSAAVLAEAAAEVARGQRVSVILLSPTVRRHSVRFEHPGIWVQRGGLFGAADRTEPAFRWRRFGARCNREWNRVLPFREENPSTRR